jgi:hypothetical protein
MRAAKTGQLRQKWRPAAKQWKRVSNSDLGMAWQLTASLNTYSTNALRILSLFTDFRIYCSRFNSGQPLFSSKMIILNDDREVYD